VTPTEKLQDRFTDHLILGFRDGRCVASAWKRQGHGAERENARTVAEWARKGLDIQTLHKDDPRAKAAHDQMYEDARAAFPAPVSA
jgi:hypothetical protein